MTLKILSLKEAAKLLAMTPEGLRRKIIKGEIPAIKPGKCWCFIEDDLVEYLRSLYTNKAQTVQGVHMRGKKIWHSKNVIISGGLDSPTKDVEYNKALGLPTK